VTDGPSGDHDTETMARIYLQQGKVAEAAAIYRRLLDRAADDASQIAHLEARRAAARQRVVEAAAGPPTPEVDLCAIVPWGPGQAACLWEITPRGRSAAQRQLAGARGRVVLRVVVWIPGPTGGETSRWERDLVTDADAGEQVVELPAAGGHAVAAVGLQAASGAFAAIAHAAPRLVPAALPAPGPPPLVMEVAPPESVTEPDPAEGRMIEP